MPRPSSQAQTRFAMLRVNQGFFGVISQSAKTSRGSRSGDSLTCFPPGKAAVCGAILVAVEAGEFDAQLDASALVLSGSQKTTSSFHSRVGLYPICEKNAAMPANRLVGQLSARVPMKVKATAPAIPSGVRFCMAR